MSKRGKRKRVVWDDNKVFVTFRDSQNRPVVTTCLLLGVDDVIEARGVAICGPLDNPCKKRGRLIAEGRALAAIRNETAQQPPRPEWKIGRTGAVILLFLKLIPWVPSPGRSVIDSLPFEWQTKAEYRPGYITDAERQAANRFIQAQEKRYGEPVCLHCRVPAEGEANAAAV
ncbi:MAG: hypothetical protein WC654_04370 [Patescibacteria group bacterium]